MVQNRIETDDFGKPLVSIVIVAYNSSKYILETLESAKDQTYKNIELIITDDGSQDSTISICENWISQYEDRFIRTAIVMTTKNTGISINVNRGLNECQGKWIKFIAGDDILLENCITDCINYCNENPSCEVLYGRTYMYSKNQLNPKPNPPIVKVKTIAEQKKLIFFHPSITAVSNFINKKMFESLGALDRDYLFLDDWPFYIKLTENNIMIHFMDKFITNYRIHENNISKVGIKNFYNVKYYRDIEKLALKKLMPYYLINFHLLECFHYINYILISRMIIITGNKNNYFSQFLNLLILKDSFNRGMIVLNKVLNRNQNKE